MNIWLRRSLQTAVITGGFLALGAGVAHADEATYRDVSETIEAASSSDGIGSGNNVTVPVVTPVKVSNNAASAAGGEAVAGGSDAAESKRSTNDSPSSDGESGSSGIGSGNNVDGSVDSPITVTDNAASAAGGEAVAAGGSPEGEEEPVEEEAAEEEAPAAAESKPMRGGDKADGIGSGNDVTGLVVAPVDVTGNAANAGGGTAVAAGGSDTESAPAAAESKPMHGGSGSDGILSGNDATLIGVAPVKVSDNAISGLGGDAVAAGSAATDVVPASSQSKAPAIGKGGADGIVTGNDVFLGLFAPIDVSNNAITILGGEAIAGGPGTEKAPASGKAGADEDFHAIAQAIAFAPIYNDPARTDLSMISSVATKSASVAGASTPKSAAASSDGIGSENDATVVGVAPFDLTDNAIAGGGGAAVAGLEGPSEMSAPSTKSARSGSDGIGSGNDANGHVVAPIKVSGNAISALGGTAVAG